MRPGRDLQAHKRGSARQYVLTYYSKSEARDGKFQAFEFRSNAPVCKYALAVATTRRKNKFPAGHFLFVDVGMGRVFLGGAGEMTGSKARIVSVVALVALIGASASQKPPDK